jgi:hypothetical protein
MLLLPPPPPPVRMPIGPKANGDISVARSLPLIWCRLLPPGRFVPRPKPPPIIPAADAAAAAAAAPAGPLEGDRDAGAAGGGYGGVQQQQQQQEQDSKAGLADRGATAHGAGSSGGARRGRGPSPARRALGLVYTFFVSGAMHEVLLWVCTGDSRQAGKQLLYFMLQVGRLAGRRVAAATDGGNAKGGREVAGQGRARLPASAPVGREGLPPSPLHAAPPLRHQRSNMLSRLGAELANVPVSATKWCCAATLCKYCPIAPSLQVPLLLGEQGIIKAATTAGIRLPRIVSIVVTSLTLQARIVASSAGVLCVARWPCRGEAAAQAI